jgi:hypothetical protein
MQTIKMIKWGVLALAVLLLPGACASRPPSLITFPTESGAVQYFFPMKEWEGRKNDIKAIADITYRHEPGALAVCNFSFSFTGKTGGEVPPLPREVFFTGDGIRYPLSGIDTLFSNPQNRQIRVTSLLGGEDLLAVLRSHSIELGALFDETEYRYLPPKDFLSYRDLFLAAIAE